jgi:hypothetical protein
MTSYRRFIAPVPMGGATAASGFPTIMGAYLHNKEHGRQKAALDVWEEEGGSVTKTAVAALNMAPGGDATAPVTDRAGSGCAVHQPTVKS